MSSFELRRVDGFTTGTVGPKGQRVFYLQATHDGEVVSLKLEKQQVMAMAAYLAELLSDLPEAEPGPTEAAPELITPVEPLWVVGAMGAAYDPEADAIVLMAEEATAEDDDADAAVATFRLTRPQVAAFVERAQAVVEAGRPPCPYCSRPLDHGEDGFCPCWN